MTFDELKKKAHLLPETPGVYIMRDKNGTVIYVGKAKALKSRVSQYFFELSSHTLKTRRMVANIFDFETVFAPSEFEAFLIESTLIKKYKPKYNILLKDDKGYPFICLSPGPYGNFSIVSRADSSKRCFGPYGGRGSANEALKTVREIFKLPTCSRKFPRDILKERPCLVYDLKKCCAPCSGKVSEEEYKKLTEEACLALEGKVGKLIQNLRKEMEERAEALDFEAAALIRDRIRSLEKLKATQNVTGIGGGEYDAIAYASKGSKGCLSVMTCSGGSLSDKKVFFFDGLEENDGEDVIGSFIKQYYPEIGRAPMELCLSVLPEDKEALEEMLRKTTGTKTRLTLPRIGEKKKFLDIAIGNCYSELETKNTWEARAMAPTRALEKMAGLRDIEIIEAYDISNTAGHDTVASMTVFEKGRAAKRRWRKFTVKEAAAGDDTGAMAEVLGRRIKKALEGIEAFLPLPDLILADGGVGQVRAAEKVLSENGLSIPVLGMVKNEHHRTRALVRSDGSEIGIRNVTQVFAFIGNIQEKTHDYAVEYHNRVRSKKAITSKLDEIPGIGPRRRDTLLRRFGSVKRIKDATKEELSAVLPSDLAALVLESLNKAAEK